MSHFNIILKFLILLSAFSLSNVEATSLFKNIFSNKKNNQKKSKIIPYKDIYHSKNITQYAGFNNLDIKKINHQWGYKIISPKNSKSSVRLVTLSDFHSLYSFYAGDITGDPSQFYGSENRNKAMNVIAQAIPGGDFLIIAGDLTNAGTEEEIYEFGEFIEVLSSVKKFKHIIIVPGNHDSILDVPYYLVSPPKPHKYPVSQNPEEVKDKFIAQLPSNVHYLEKHTITLEGLKITGVAHTVYTSWANAFSVSKRELEEIWENIPKDTDILVTHMPPYKIKDAILDVSYAANQDNLVLGYAGDKSLRKKIMELPNLKAHVFGHIHDDFGAVVNPESGSIFINTAIHFKLGQPNRAPLVLDLDLPSKSPE